MKPKLSLKGLLLASFVSLGLVLMLAYSAISTNYFIRGLDASVANNMEKAARTFLQLVDKEARRQGREFSGFYLSTDWKQMPSYVHRAFPRPPETSQILYKVTDSPWFRRPRHMVFVMRYESEKEPLYISLQMAPPAKSNVADATARQNNNLC